MLLNYVGLQLIMYILAHVHIHVTYLMCKQVRTSTSSTASFPNTQLLTKKNSNFNLGFLVFLPPTDREYPLINFFHLHSYCFTHGNVTYTTTVYQ